MERREFIGGEAVEELSADAAHSREKLRYQGLPGSRWLDDDRTPIRGARSTRNQRFRLEAVEEASDPGIVGSQAGCELRGCGIRRRTGSQEQRPLLAGKVEGSHLPVHRDGKVPCEMEDEVRDAPVQISLMRINRLRR